MRRKTHTHQAISVEEESIIAKSVAEFRRKKLKDTRIAETSQANEIKTTNINEIAEDPSNSNYNTINACHNLITTPQESNTNNSHLSVALLPSLAERQNKNTNPAFSVADVAFSTDKTLLSTARDISGHMIQYDNKETRCLVVNLQTVSLALLLNPVTKKITKTESNKIQQVEMNRWNTSDKKQIYVPNTGMFYKNL